ncbi:MAG: 30S ribosomal protein S17 [bacterium]
MPISKGRPRLEGTVVSNKMDKTVVVSVQRKVKEPFYKKYLLRRKKYAAHDEKNLCKEGDFVEIVSTRPLSKTKRWAVSKILKTAETSEPAGAGGREQAR